MSERVETGMRSLPQPFPPGWYPDPWTPGGVRYFDGYGWTDRQARPAGAPWPVAVPKPPHPTMPIQIAIGAIVVLAASLITSRTTLPWLVELTDWPVIVYVLISAAIGYGPSLLWGRYAVGRWKPGFGPIEATGPRVRWRDLGWGVVIWLAAVLAQYAVVWIVFALDIPITGNTDGYLDLDIDRTVVITQLVLTVVAAPLVEEYVFRGLILRGFLSKMPAVAAIGLQSVLFGFAHFGPERGVGNIGLVMALSGVGVVLGGAAYLLRRVPPAVVGHAIFNGVVMAIVLSR